MQEIQLDKIEKAFVFIQNEHQSTDQIQSLDLLMIKLDNINSYLAWSGEQMAIAKRLLNIAKEKAYRTLKTSSEANKQYYSPSLAKDYIAAKCSDEAYCYDMAERLSRSMVHISDNLRTSISALKEQMKMESYSQNAPSY